MTALACSSVRSSNLVRRHVRLFGALNFRDPCFSPLRRGFLLIWLVLACFALSPPAQAQLPNIFAADDPSGSVNSGGANIAYLQNTTGSDVTLTLDGYTITTKANRLNIFDRSSGTWLLQKVILNQQTQPVSPSNTFSTPTPTPTTTPTT